MQITFQSDSSIRPSYLWLPPQPRFGHGTTRQRPLLANSNDLFSNQTGQPVNQLTDKGSVFSITETPTLTTPAEKARLAQLIQLLMDGSARKNPATVEALFPEKISDQVSLLSVPSEGIHAALLKPPGGKPSLWLDFKLSKLQPAGSPSPDDIEDPETEASLKPPTPINQPLSRWAQLKTLARFSRKKNDTNTQSDNQREGTTDIGNLWLAKLASKFSFAAIQKETPENNHIQYERPAIDHDSLQLTVYCPVLVEEKLTKKSGKPVNPGSNITDTIAQQKLRLYLGEDFLVTTHRHKRPTIEHTLKLLRQTGKAKTSAELMNFIVGNSINRYGNVIDSLSYDFAHLSNKVGQPTTDDSIQQDSLNIQTKINLVYNTVVRQKQVLSDLLELNEFHQSPLANTLKVFIRSQELDHHLRSLNDFQTQVRDLTNLYRARISNDMDDTMKRLTVISVMGNVCAVLAGLFGMNVALPALVTFGGVVGGMIILNAGIYSYMKYKKYV